MMESKDIVPSGFGSRTTVEQISSGEARDDILSQHRALRGLLAEIAEIASRQAQSGDELAALRERARVLYQALGAHMTFEEQLLPAALRDVIGWGAVLQQSIEQDHARQRQTLARAIHDLEPNGLAGSALLESMDSFAATLLLDMESEERELMQADVDALSIDSKGG